MIRQLLFAVAAISILAGCAAKAPAAWMLYSRANYLYGRIEALTEQQCKSQTLADWSSVCKEAAAVQKEIKAINPVVQAELSKEEPDWGRIFQYVDLVLGVAGKFIIP